jgi:hypothetical protein
MGCDCGRGEREEMRLMPRCLLLVTVVMCSGCIPWRFSETAHFGGKVLDQTTKRPVANAKIYTPGFPKEVVVTSADGHFDCPAIHQWRAFYLIPVADINREWHMHAFVIEASGYKTDDMFIPGEWEADISHQVIFLTPLNSN